MNNDGSDEIPPHFLRVMQEKTRCGAAKPGCGFAMLALCPHAFLRSNVGATKVLTGPGQYPPRNAHDLSSIYCAFAHLHCSDIYGVLCSNWQ
jgi:hypothetical protein